MGYISKITNDINGKIYIGKTEFSDPFFKGIGLNHFTVDTAAGTFLHELGHWHHLQEHPSDVESMQIWSSLVTKDNEMKIASKVSVHAMTDPTGKEFVAEVFAGLQTGQIYDEEVMNIYTALKGPLLN